MPASKLSDSPHASLSLGRRGEMHEGDRRRSDCHDVDRHDYGSFDSHGDGDKGGRSSRCIFCSEPARVEPEVIDGVSLIPMTAFQRDECQKFADHLKRRVPCPGLLPDPIPDTSAIATGRCIGEVGAFGQGSCGPAVSICQCGSTHSLT
jgi:hypothetical protein